MAHAASRLDPLGRTILFFPTVASTNDVALALAAHGGNEGAVVIAGEQTAGRGRRGRTWFSPPGSGLYVSVVLAPGRARIEPERAATLVPLAAGAALAEAIEAATALRVDIKWPNDLTVSRRKLGGILAEGAPGPREDLGASIGTVHTVVLGYGIDVGPITFPPELGDRATSIEGELGQMIDRAVLCVETLAWLAKRYEDLLAARFDAILDAWRARAPQSRGARVSWQTFDGLRTGITDGIDERGALLVRVGDRIERVVAGEITWL